MDKNNISQGIDLNSNQNDSKFESNQNQFESNQNQFDSNQNQFESNQNQFTPSFPLTKVAAAKLLGKTDVAIGKWIDKLFTVFSELEKTKFFHKGKITQWGFQELVAYGRATSFEIPEFEQPKAALRSRTNGQILWNENGSPVATIENPNRIPSNNYLRNLQNTLLMAEAEVLSVEAEITSSALVPVDINEITAFEAISMDKIEADALIADAMSNIEKTDLLYQKVRGIQRRQAASRGVRDAAEDAQIYTRSYQAAASHIEKKKLETENNDED